LSQEQQLQSITKVKLKLIKIKSLNYIFDFHSDSTHFNAKLMELWKKFQDKALSSKELLGELAKLSRKQAKKSWEDLENTEGQDEEQESD
jgi:hypothetical protein